VPPTRWTLIALALVPALAAPPAALAAHPIAWADSSASRTVAADAHRPERWSLDFGLTGNFALTSFKGTSISATRSTSPTRAWRYGLTYGVGAGGSNSAGVFVADSVNVGLPGNVATNQNLSLGAIVLRLHRIHPGRPVSAYLGFGPEVSWQRQHTQTNFDVRDSMFAVEHFYQHDVFFGVALDLGVEAIVARDVGLFAQYGSEGGYGFSRQVRRDNTYETSPGNPVRAHQERSNSSHRWTVSPSTVRFGVSLYL
jgi:hypothetical protein